MSDLTASEPVLRYKALLKYLLETRIDLEEQEGIDIISLLRDSNKKIRFAAGNVLSKYSTNLKQNLLNLAISGILKSTITVYSNIETFKDFDKFTARVVLESRIQAIYNLKGFIKHIDSNQKICEYLNFILKNILESGNVLLIRAAIEFITVLPRTQRNIVRVFTLFYPRIIKLEGSHEQLLQVIDTFRSVWEHYQFKNEICIKDIKIRILKGIGGIRNFTRELLISESGISETIQFWPKFESQAKEEKCIASQKGFLKFGPDLGLVLASFPFQETVYIKNTSIDKEISFGLQVFPVDFFTVSPAFGNLKGGESMGIKVKFRPNPINNHLLQVIYGFIRIKSMGLAMDRLEIAGYNLPHVKIAPDNLDFDIIQIFETKSGCISIENLLPVDISAVTVLKRLEKDSPFNLESSQVSLKASSRTNIPVHFHPRKGKGIIKEQLIICILGVIYRVELVGFVGEPLAVMNRKLDFGFTHISSEKPCKKLYLMNESKKSLPVALVSSTNEISINDGKPIILEPLEQRAIPVEFSANLTGTRKEHIQVLAPYSSLSIVDVFSFVGQSLLIPIQEDIFFPVVMVDGMSSAQFPITNVYSTSIQFSLMLPMFSPFKIMSVEWERYNNKSTSTGILADVKPFDAGGKNGYLITLGTNVTAVVELSFSPSLSRMVRTPLEISAVKPTKSYSRTLFLNAIALDLSFFRQEGLHLSQVRKFSRNPFRESVTSTFSKSPMTEMKRLRNSSKIFQLDPPTQIVFGTHLEKKLRTDIYEYVTLTNTTNRTQNFQLIVSQHFVVDIPLEGELPSLSSLQIPIRLNRYFFTNGVGITEETASFTGAGSITVLDFHTSNPGTASVNLYGIMNDLVDIELRPDMTLLTFPNCAPSQSLTRSIHLRNCVPMAVVWEAGIGSVDDKMMQSRIDSSTFKLSSNRVMLKPYEYATIDISFGSTLPGFYQAKLFMEYRDFIEHGGIFDRSIIEPSRSLKGVDMSGLVGNHFLDIDSTFIDFGRVSFDSVTHKQIQLTNMSHESTSLIVNQSSSFTYFLNDIKLKPSSNAFLDVSFQAASKQFCSDYLLTVYPFSFSSIYCFAWSGTVSLSSNLGIFHESKGNDAYVLKAKQINVGLEQRKIVPITLKNDGSFDIIISEINLEGEPVVCEYQLEDDILSRFYRPLSEKLDENSALFDGDEFEYLSSHPKSVKSASLFSLKKRTQSKDVLKISKSINRLNSKSTNIKSKLETYIFPILLLPGKTLDLHIIINSNIKGNIQNSLQFIVETFGQLKKNYSIQLPLMVQPLLSIEPDILDFGVCSNHRNHVSTVTFTNKGDIPLNWEAQFLNTLLKCMIEKDKQDIVNNSAPLEIFPLSGLLLPDHSQKLQIKFAPVYKNYEFISLLNICTESFGSSKLMVKGVGACSIITIDKESLKFGALRIGTKSSMKVTVKNRGNLSARFHLESSSVSFSTDPEVFVIEGMCEVVLSIIFCPKDIGNIKTTLLIVPSNLKENQTLTLKLEGTGSYPDVTVLTRKVDFGVALYMNRNIMPIEIENKGAAEAEISFICNHQGIQLENHDQSAVIKPLTTQIFNLVYTPQIVETLDSKIFIRSTDSRSFEFVVFIKGKVGVPKLVFEPPEVVAGLNFDTTFLFKTAQRDFIIRNDGNIVLNFKITAEKMKENVLMGNLNEQNGLSSLMPNDIFSIEPESGLIQVGQSKVIVVKFTPSRVMEYHYDLILSYDYQTKRVPLFGNGGQYLLQMDNQLRSIDFGLCRINRFFQKVLKLKNLGNLGFRYFVRPEPRNHNWEEYRDDVLSLINNADINSIGSLNLGWEAQIAALGYKISNYQGFCPPGEFADVIISFSPLSEAASGMVLRIFYEDKFLDIEIQGQGAHPKLSVYDPLTLQYIRPDGKSTIDIGVHPVDSCYGHIVQLINEGAFGLDFYVQPMTLAEFDVGPVRGYIEPQDSIPLTIKFRASAENNFHSPLKIFWEKKSIKANIVGKGGLGKMQLTFNGNDSLEKGFNFGNLPLGSSNQKKFAINNVGMVSMSVIIDVVHDEFAIAIGSDSLSISQASSFLYSGLIPNSDRLKWGSAIRLLLEPNTGIVIVVKFSAKSTTLASANLVVKTEFDRLSMPVVGHGGTIVLSHRGDLNFGEIACNYTYSRNIVLVNSGSISANMSARFALSGHPCTENDPAFVKFSEVYTGLDPRAGWAKQQFCREKDLDPSKAKLAPRENWKLVAFLILKHLVKEDVISDSSKSKLVIGRRSSIVGIMSNSHARISASGLKKIPNVNASTHFKRKQMFYHLITTTQLTSQSTCRVKPFMKAHPSFTSLPNYGEIEYSVEVNVANETPIIGTLTLTSDIPNTSPYEISISLQPKSVNIICNDSRMLNFYRQPLGGSETIVRTFSNVGKKEITFKFLNPNSSLVISPPKGALKIGQSITVTFTFTPTDEGIQNSDVIFEPDCSQPIKLKMYGGGGQAIASLYRYRRFDFGHCMIGKETISYLPVLNEGNAVLHLTKFELVETATFFKGPDWPLSRISLFPGKSFNLPIVFNPSEESVSPGRLVVGTNSESFEIELTGSGREAVLIVSKVALEFSECLIGNSYEQKLGLKNIGDVNYPVTFKLEKEFPDVEFVPSSMLITPFTENFVIVSYTPSRETKTTIVLTIQSPYSTHKVPLLLHAGTAILEFESSVLDFGLFEKTTKPILNLVFKNTGTVRTSYLVKDPNKPSMFFISQPKGILPPGKSVEVPIMHVRHEIEEFEHKLIIKSDLVNKIYNIKARGQCEETIIHHGEFSTLNLGTCPVLESSSKPLSFKNYGRFPLSYNIKASYPLKVVPAIGKVEADQTETVLVTWSPSGAYELRSQIVMDTNIGSFNINIRGKAIFADLSVDNMYIDFGICAVDHVYQRKIVVENHGKVISKFSIPDSRDPSFWVSKKTGILEPKQKAEIDIFFKPNAIQRFLSSIMVECKGIHYKEIATIGVGGVHKLEIIPSSIDLGRFPFNLQSTVTFALKNSGDVLVEAEFNGPKSLDQNCIFFLPEPVSIPPGRTIKCSFGIKSQIVGPFTSEIGIQTIEGLYIVPIKGLVVQIHLTERNREILKSEKIATTQALETGRLIYKMDELDLILKRYSKSFKNDMEIANKFGELYAKVGVGSEMSLENLKTETLTKEILESLENPSLQILDSLFDRFIQEKQSNYQGYTIIQDNHIQEILEYGHLEIQPVSYQVITSFVEPKLDLDFNIVLDRPSPFLGPEKKTQKDKKSDNFSKHLPLLRQSRNAKTVDFFKT